jgi:hypothetical protein
MIVTPVTIRFDSTSGAWSDGKNYVKGQLIRRYAIESLGRKSVRGRLSRDEISAYWLDRFGVNADVL